MTPLTPELGSNEQAIVEAVKTHASRLLNHTPRFKYFTLHGTTHLNNLFEILNILRKGGVSLNKEELFLLSLAICIHDLGMVVPLANKETKELFDGRPDYPDVAVVENYVRETHHDRIDEYFRHELDFLLSLGITPPQLALVRDISRCHRKVVLQNQSGMVKYLGALLRVIDELDIGPARAPADMLRMTYEEMDATSCWHWFKHNIVEPWMEDHTITYMVANNRQSITFTLVVHPTRQGSIDYWLHQIRRPIQKVLHDDGAAQIIRDKFQVDIQLHASLERSAVNVLNPVWQRIEERALSANRQVILVIDDEARKLEDLFLPLMESYHVIFAASAKDAFEKLGASPVTLAIVDMQVGSAGLWNSVETQDFKSTGINICSEIHNKYPNTKMGVLTGTRHAIPPMDPAIRVEFFLRKPVDPTHLTKTVHNVLR